MKPTRMIATALAAVITHMFVFSATILAEDAAKVVGGDLRVDGIHFTADGSVIRRLSDLSSIWTTSGDNIYYLGGNVGIGTMTPAQKLSVAGTIEANGLAVGTNQLVVTGSKVGIGTATPNEQLEITGNLRLPATTDTTGIIKQNNINLIHTYGSQNFFAGGFAGNLTMSAGFNTAIGYAALQSNTTGTANTASGWSALNLNTTGHNNTASGNSALQKNTKGYGNTANGSGALKENTIGSANTACGGSALRDNNSLLRYNLFN